jgi:hypothetical protein
MQNGISPVRCTGYSGDFRDAFPSLFAKNTQFFSNPCVFFQKKRRGQPCPAPDSGEIQQRKKHDHPA